MRIVNLTATTISVRFTLRVLFVCVRFLQPWLVVNELQCGPHVVL